MYVFTCVYDVFEMCLVCGLGSVFFVTAHQYVHASGSVVYWPSYVCTV